MNAELGCPYLAASPHSRTAEFKPHFSPAFVFRGPDAQPVTLQ